MIALLALLGTAGAWWLLRSSQQSAPSEYSIGRVLLVSDHSDSALAARLANSAIWQALQTSIPAELGQLQLRKQGRRLHWHWAGQAAVPFESQANTPTDAQLERLACLAMASSSNAMDFLPMIWRTYLRNPRENLVIFSHLAEVAGNELTVALTAVLTDGAGPQLPLLQLAEIASAHVPALLDALAQKNAESATALLALASQTKLDLPAEERAKLAVGCAPYTVLPLPLAPGADRVIKDSESAVERSCQAMAVRALLVLEGEGIAALTRAMSDKAMLILPWALERASQQDAQATLNGLAVTEDPAWIARHSEDGLANAMKQARDWSWAETSEGCQVACCWLVQRHLRETATWHQQVRELLNTQNNAHFMMLADMAWYARPPLPMTETQNSRAGPFLLERLEGDGDLWRLTVGELRPGLAALRQRPDYYPRLLSLLPRLDKYEHQMALISLLDADAALDTLELRRVMTHLWETYPECQRELKGFFKFVELPPPHSLNLTAQDRALIARIRAEKPISEIDFIRAPLASTDAVLALIEYGRERPNDLARSVEGRATLMRNMTTLPTGLEYGDFYTATLHTKSSVLCSDLLISLLTPVADVFSGTSDKTMVLFHKKWPEDHAIHTPCVKEAIEGLRKDEIVGASARAILDNSGLSEASADRE